MIFTPSLISSSNAHSWIIEGRAGENRDKFVKDMIDYYATSELDIVHMDKTAPSGGYCTDDAAAFIQRLRLGSYGPHLVGIIDNADMLSDIIQNKLLKTLEEPEEGTVIILVTNNIENLLLTVRSRCGKIRISDDESEDGKIKTEDFAVEHFYAFRNAVDKKIKSQEDAIALLSAMEDDCREAMVGGDKSTAFAQSIELIEQTRSDIYRGMKYDKALKRLFLELAD